VVDDGSSDGTTETLKSYSEGGRLHYIRHDKNRGYSAACNTGMSAAMGDVIAFLDSDDLWKSTYLERQVKFLLMHPELDAVFTDTEISGEEK
jgi:glycosyltransferase involved in cell wall biosynthesis